MSRSGLPFVYAFLLIYTAVHLPQVQPSSGSVPAPQIHLVLDSSDFQAVGHTVYDFEPGGIATSYRLLFSADCPNSTFSIDASTGEMIIAQAVEFPAEDQEPKCVLTPSGYVYSLRTYNCFTVVENLSQSYGVSTVIDVIPALPNTQIKFPQEFYPGEVTEGVLNVPVLGAHGIQAMTTPVNNLLTPNYRIINQSFFIASTTSTLCETFVQIQAAQPLDREIQDYYEVVLEAYTAQVSANTTIGIHVLDSNDKVPEFLSPPESITISSRLQIGAEVTQFQAADQDSGLNSALLFSLASKSSPFAINPITGSLYRYSSQDLTQTTESVSVWDSGSPQQTSLVNLTIFIATEHQHVFDIHALGPLTVSEGNEIGRVVTNIEITTSSSNSISVSSDSMDCSCFELSDVVMTAEGEYEVDLYASTILDYESFPNGIRVIITASDNENMELSTSQELTIMITDTNEPPVFPLSHYEVSVLEGVPVGSEVIQLRAADPDSGTNGELTYTITSSNDDNNYLSLDSSLGILSTASNIDYESVTSIELTVMAEDGGGETASTSIAVVILDRNDHKPSFTNLQTTISVPETRLANESLFDFSASDSDSQCNGAISYSIVHADPPAFRLDSVSGLLYPLSDDSLDYEEFQNAKLIVRATDLGEGTHEFSDITLMITITNENDEHPHMDSIQCPCFMEELSLTEQCQQLSAHDADSTDLVFSIQSGDESNMFSINPNSGVVSTTVMLRYEEQADFMLQIVASDGEFKSDPETLHIIVVDVNNHGPMYSSSSIEITSPIDLPVGSLVGDLGAHHRDAGFNALTEYEFAGAVPPVVTDVLRLDALSGLLYLKSSPQSEMSLGFTVSATDTLGVDDSATASVTVTFSGHRNRPPYFLSSVDRIDIASNSATNIQLYEISAADDDDGNNGQLEYSLASSSDYFEVQSDGGLILTQSLGDEVGSEFTIFVLVSDGGSPSLNATQQLTITVYESRVEIGGQELLHNPGLGIRHSFGSIPEGSSQSLFVASLPTTEGGNAVSYTILPQGQHYLAFSVVANEVMTESNFETIFDRMQNEAVFVTLRAQYGTNFYHHSLTVVIEDRNNHGPEFDQEEYYVEIYDNTPVGAFIFQFDAEDPDIGSNAITEYSIASNTNMFAIVSNTSFLEVTGELTESLYTLSITAVDPELGESATATIEITVLGTTNNPPSITSDTFTVSESVGIGNVVGTVTVTDADNGIHGDNTLCVVSGNTGDHFRVNQNGEIITQRQLDHETKSSFTLSMQGYDSSPNPASSITQVTVTVTDDNDSPEFMATKYFATIVENNSPGSPVLMVAADDTDSGSAGEVTYSILNGTSSFSIHQDSGLISADVSLNREAMSLHSFTVAATDGGGMMSTALVQISVLDQNDVTPSLTTPNYIPLLEDTEVGEQVLLLQAMDRDEGSNGTVQFQIVGGNDDNIFSLNSETGSVTLRRELDYETDAHTYNVEFVVSDLGIPQLTASAVQVTFEVQNINDNFPTFSSTLYACQIQEGSSDFNSTCQVSATDADAVGNVITYEITSGNIEGAFQINSQSGILTPQGSLNREIISRYALSVQAADSGSPSLSSTAIVLIEIQDENDQVPLFDPSAASHLSENGLSSFRFPELLPPNTLLFFAHAVDYDVGENSEISYDITSGNTSLFRIDSNTSAVILAGSFDFESTRRYELGIRATNPSGTSTSQMYTIDIFNVNENQFRPAFSPNSPTAVTVPCTTPTGTHLTTVNATDKDPGPDGEIRYYITGGTGYGYFHVDQLNGSITSSYILTGIEAVDVYIEVMAIDLGNPPLSSMLRVLVILQPDPEAKPFFISPQFVAFAPEGFSSIGKIFSSVQAFVNGYPSSDVIYCVVSGNNEGKFAINSSTGAISVNDALDREEKSLYSLVVNASRDSSNDSSLALVAITVADVNSFRPLFETIFDVTIFSNHPTGSNNPFIRIFAQDLDIGQNSRLAYSITSEDNRFAINSSTGDVYLTQSLPTTGSSSYDITVRVTDMGTQPLDREMTFTVMVTSPAGSNNNAPSFSFSSDTVHTPENSDPGTVLYTAQASDDDDVLVYRIINPHANFAILPNSGEVYLIQRLDREEEDQYTLRIEASDGSLSSSTFLLNIVVTDVNDNQPIFTTDEFVFTVTEHSQSGTTVGSLTADDIDTGMNGDTITYSLVDSLHPSSIQLFSLTTGGTLQVAGVIDREERPVHTLTVSAGDGGTPSLMSYARVTIIVTDINDHVPEVHSPLPSISISENITVGTPFFNVSIFDPDTGVRGSYTYSLEPNTVPFAVNASTGELYVASQLNAEQQEEYSFTINVANPDDPSLTATFTLQVNITDELDTTPVLTSPVTVSIPENQPAYTIVAVVADTVSLRFTYYNITSGNDEGHFFIEPLTGIIRTAIPLDREAIDSYSLTVQGAFEPGYESSVTFTVLVSDLNDAAPVFSSRLLEYTLPEDSTLLIPLLHLNITDNDEGTNSQIGKFLIPDSEIAKIFSVDSSGNLLLHQTLDREGKLDVIIFDLYIFDSGNPPLYDLARVSITVSDVNDNPPHFLQSSYHYVVSLPVLVDTALFSVQAEDPDVSATMRYSFSDGNGTDKFSINAITGDITVMDNYKLQPYYSLTVRASDGGGREASVLVNITTKECGFNDLLFDPRDVRTHFSENTALNTIIFQPNILQFGDTSSLKFYFSTDDALFQINNDTGVVRLKRNLDRETQAIHYFSVQARAVDTPNRLAQADIEVVVTDVNDNTPRFQLASYTVYITDDHQTGSALLRVQALDPDEGSNGVVMYSLVSGALAVFDIAENTGEISLISEIDTSVLGTLITLEVEATDSGEPYNSAVATVTVNIVDSNAPLFTMNGAYSAQVNESAPRDTVVITVLANATSMAPQIRYVIESPDLTDLPFSIDFSSGEVTVNGIGLDYETNTSYRLQLVSIDLSTSLEGRAVLDIQIIDVNDNRPEFNMAFYEESLIENTAIGTFVVEVNATDADSGTNADITYSIDPNDIATTFFNIDGTSGRITTSGEIDREENSFFEFSVFAIDGGDVSLTGTATIRIATLDINDNAPSFLESSYHETVSEDDPSGTSILFVTATDRDEDSIEYRIEPTEGSSNFEISSGGLLTLNTPASELTEFEYILNISAFDGDFYGYARVVVEVEDQNNHAPMFNQSIYNAYVVEHTSIDTYVTQVYATDDDRGSNAEIFYSVSDERFSVHINSGVIRVSGDVDREASSDGIVRLIVVARDGGGRTGTAEVHIELEDINDNEPMFSSSSYIIDVSETVPIGTTVSSAVTATDPDDGSNGSIQYSTTEEMNLQFPFTIDSSSGAIITRAELDYDFESQYIFTMDAVDSGSPQMNATPASVTINVIDDGQNSPTFENSTYIVNLPEDTSSGNILTVQLEATLDCLAVEFQIIQPDTIFTIQHSDPTALDATIAIGFCSSCLDHETQSQHAYNLGATCTAFVSGMFQEFHSFAILIVNVLDVNDEPSFSTPFLLSSIMENIALSTILQLREGDTLSNAVSATDEDTAGPNSVIQYSIAQGNVPFAVGHSSGIITVNGELDRETTDRYSFTVIATDSGNPPLSDSVLVFVTIEDANDSPPVFERSTYYAEVSEGAPINSSVITVTASDNDTAEFAQNTYSISGGEFFGISSTLGQIITVRQLDRETMPMHIIQVLANDGVNQDSTSVIINVTDVNDNRPIFNQTQYEVTLPENYDVGVVILQVFATDADEGENAEIYYSILESQQLIEIDNSTGEVRFAQIPDYEMGPRGHYEFQVRASNTENEDMRDLVPLVIELLDLNDNAPLFSEAVYSVQVGENRPAGTTVTRVEAVDADSGRNGTVVYTLNAEAQEYFQIDSGIITTNMTFDREVNASFEVIVTASDLGTPPLFSSALVLIAILDVNDNPPIFSERNYTAIVPELADIDTVILNVQAEDADTGINSEVTYRLMGENSAHFALDPKQDGSVDIQVAVLLNHEQIPLYELIIMAFDGGFPVMETIVPLTIIVQDQNDNPPVFTLPLHMVRVAENITVGSEIARVQATDQDSIDDAQLIYSIVDADIFSQFQIDNEGSITIAQALDYETDQSYTFFVQADDLVFSASATVIVTVTNINDNAPEFMMSNYSTTVVENAAARQLFDFTVIDRDIGANPDTVSFRIESGNDDDIFTLDTTSGALSVKAGIDFESLSTDQYLLIITASDNENPPLSGTAYVSITVEDVNDNPPVGEDQVIYVFLYNGQLALNTLGTLLIRDPDTVNDHQFVVSGIISTAFSIDSEGSINIIEFPPPPSLNIFTVHVTDGDLGSATTNVTISVVNITDAHIANSFTMQVDTSSVESFLDNNLQPFLAMIEDIITGATTSSSPRAYVYNIQPSAAGSSSLDLTVVVESGDHGFVHPNLVQHLLHISRDNVAEMLGLRILTEDVELCTDDSVCPIGMACVVSHQYSPSSMVLGSAAASLVGLEKINTPSCSVPTTLCTISCPEPSYCVQENGRSVCRDDCTPNPCKNNGQCQDQNPGYYCVCLSGYEGRNCELKTSYFKEDSYAIFPAVDSPTNGSIHFEFTTNERNGLLYYSSRFDDNQNDFVALEMADFYLSLLVSYGGDDMRLSTETPLTSNNWYTAVVQYSSTVSSCT